ncbi:MAG: 4-hydroxy-tetrahydrodipicolinate reductase [Candidatus Abyssobacteria bacterium SURF_17]|jgi:4-hydroxy-tetrahydrodipicolinate reductase|uniref:4-hydroxy-tetrahydrodipicolinate reductase n=1 Tax=Candidatus Abyssobacteria bacterium SURF_17 TaxID=2093361 RepID=A0A419EVN2_9BACT|nr:MAG: 4-hydroxy-tetrahydrodipicolinate reductase [Candidatus Abyssubacteria bacterium SURF_17]
MEALTVPLRIGIFGACGRMGRRIAEIANADKEFQVAAGIEYPGHPAVGQSLGKLCSIPDLEAPLVGSLHKVINDTDCIIAFATPEATLDCMRDAHADRKPLVIGTTGFNPDQLEEIKRLSQHVPCLMSANMSIGINVLLALSKQLAKLIGDSFDIEIVEAHHNQKKDAPSGTAFMLGEAIAEATNRTLSANAVYGRQGIIGPRPKVEIGIHAIRGGDIVGDHTVIFAGQGERIELTHRAHSRDNFARGALLAAQFIIRQPAGLYTMQDALKLT